MNKLIPLYLFFTTVEVYAASVEGIPWFSVVPQILNFALFLILLVFLLRNKVKDLFVQRRQDYTQLLQKAEMERDKAEGDKLKMIQKLKVLEDDAKIASKKAQSEAEYLKDEIISEGQCCL